MDSTIYLPGAIHKEWRLHAPKPAPLSQADQDGDASSPPTSNIDNWLNDHPSLTSRRIIEVPRVDSTDDKDHQSDDNAPIGSPALSTISLTSVSTSILDLPSPDLRSRTGTDSDPSSRRQSLDLSPLHHSLQHLPPLHPGIRSLSLDLQGNPQVDPYINSAQRAFERPLNWNLEDHSPPSPVESSSQLSIRDNLHSSLHFQPSIHPALRSLPRVSVVFDFCTDSEPSSPPSPTHSIFDQRCVCARASHSDQVVLSDIHPALRPSPPVCDCFDSNNDQSFPSGLVESNTDQVSLRSSSPRLFPRLRRANSDSSQIPFDPDSPRSFPRLRRAQRYSYSSVRDIYSYLEDDIEDSDQSSVVSVESFRSIPLPNQSRASIASFHSLPDLAQLRILDSNSDCISEDLDSEEALSEEVPSEDGSEDLGPEDVRTDDILVPPSEEQWLASGKSVLDLHPSFRTSFPPIIPEGWYSITRSALLHEARNPHPPPQPVPRPPVKSRTPHKQRKSARLSGCDLDGISEELSGLEPQTISTGFPGVASNKVSEQLLAEPRTDFKTTDHSDSIPALLVDPNTLASSQTAAMHSEAPTPPTPPPELGLKEIAELICADKAFENTSTSVAASQMRNALNNLADTVEDPAEKKVNNPPSSKD